MWWHSATDARPRRRGAIARAAALLFCSLIPAWPALAQAPTDAPDRDAMLRLLGRVEELERQVRELRQAAGPTLPAPTAQPDPTWQNDHGSHTSDPTNPAARVSPLAEIHWFGDVGFRTSDQQSDTDSFTLGQLDLFMTSSLTDHLNVLGELVFRAGTDNRYVVNAERLLLQYAPSRYLTLGVGRYHSAIGFYNTAYHHGSWFETAVTRPTIFAYRGGLIPIHDVGLMATGHIPSGRVGLNYVFEAGNGQSSQSTTAEATQNTLDENNGKAFNAGLFAKPENLPGLQVGFSTHRDTLRPSNASVVEQTTLAAHAVYQGPALEWLNEVVSVRSARVAGADTVTTGLYTQMSRQFADVRPYFRYQYINANPADAFRALGRRNGPTIGLRYDLGKFAAFKAQYERTARRSLPPVNGFATQLAFTF